MCREPPVLAYFRRRIQGIILGTAIGDAMGYPVEFMSLEQIRRQYPQGMGHFPESFRGIHSAHAPYSDDTQMMVATLRGLLAAGPAADLEQAARAVSSSYVSWSKSPENNRAPGAACMAGCAAMAMGVRWREAGAVSAGGCGAAMRSMAYGIWHFQSPTKAARWAAEHARMTHGHPMGYASAAALAAGIAYAVDMNASPAAIADALIDAGTFYDPATGGMLQEALRLARGTVSPEAVLDMWRGWRGDEAVAASLFCFLRAFWTGGGFREAVAMATCSPGDSDSLGAITGALAGAHVGISKMPLDLTANVEDSDMLLSLANSVVDAVWDAPIIADRKEDAGDAASALPR